MSKKDTLFVTMEADNQEATVLVKALTDEPLDRIEIAMALSQLATELLKDVLRVGSTMTDRKPGGPIEHPSGKIPS